jgi:membrane-associated protease RseP (regulator of RpoE activity)
VITIGTDSNEANYSTGYGFFTGGPPNPEARFAAFTAAASVGGSSSGVTSPYVPSPPGTSAPPAGLSPPSASIPPASGESTSLPPQRPTLGIDAEPVVDADGVRVLKISKVYPATAAEKAGLHAGDAIRSINGYRTEQTANVAWIITNAAPDNVLKLNVRAASDHQEHPITAQLP